METKTCSICDDDKPLSEFDLYRKKGVDNGYASYCKSCRREKHRVYYKDYYRENESARKAYQAARSKTKEYREAHVVYKKKNREVLTDGYIASLLASKMDISTAEVYKIEGLIEAERTRIKLHRKLRELSNTDEFRICSHCGTKKDIEEFRLRTENRKGKEPYTYRAGQCKPCESKLKNKYRNGTNKL